MSNKGDRLPGTGNSYNGLHIPSRVEVSGYFEVSWFEKLFNVTEYPVGGSLMRHIFISEIIQIEFQGFKLHNIFTGYVADFYSCKIRIPGNRAQTGEFRETDINAVVSFRMGIVPFLKQRL